MRWEENKRGAKRIATKTTETTNSRSDNDWTWKGERGNPFFTLLVSAAFIAGSVTYWKAADLTISWFSQHDVMYLQCNNKYSPFKNWHWKRQLKSVTWFHNFTFTPPYLIPVLRTKPCQNKAHQTPRKGEVPEGVFPKLILNPNSGFHHLTFEGWQKKRTGRWRLQKSIHLVQNLYIYCTHKESYK